MTWLEAAKKVLNDLSRPAHLTEIVQQAHDKGYRPPETTAKSPVATLGSGLRRLIVAKKGKCAFMQTEPGTFGLSKWRLGLLAAAERVLQEYSGGTPMSYRQITDRATELGLLKKAGSPWDSLRVEIMIREPRRLKPGAKSRFTTHPPNLVGLTEWNASASLQEVQRQNAVVAERLLLRLPRQDSKKVEHDVAALLQALDFKSVKVTTRTPDEQAEDGVGGGDKGVDVRGNLQVNDLIEIQVAVQVKAQRDNVRRPAIQALRGSLTAHEHGLFVTTSDFSRGAKTDAERKDTVPIGLVAGKTLTKLMVTHNVCVNRKANGFVYIALDN